MKAREFRIPVIPVRSETVKRKFIVTAEAVLITRNSVVNGDPKYLNTWFKELLTH